MENALPSNFINDILLVALQKALQSKLDSATLNNETKLRDDLGLDSLAMMETVWEIEEKLHIHIDETKLKEMATVGDVIKVVNDLVIKKQSGQKVAGV